MPTPKQLNDAHKQGRVAYKEGKAVWDCPYEVPTVKDAYDSKWLLSANWLNGWRFAWFADKQAKFGLVTFHPNENKQFHNRRFY
jgi:hypothetical protein